jgi:hypothetical protein
MSTIISNRSTSHPSLFQTHPLRRVDPVNKTGFIQFAHDTRVDHFFGLDLRIGNLNTLFL